MAKRKKKVKSETKSSDEYIKASVYLDLKELRLEVLKQISEVMKSGDLMQLEVKFDRQEGATFKALLDSTPAEYVTARFYFNREGKVESSVSVETAGPDISGFPQALYDLFDSEADLET